MDLLSLDQLLWSRAGWGSPLFDRHAFKRLLLFVCGAARTLPG